uniref:Retrotransposon gag domain-containing protein n=1 Tax=Nicotiana tabacum TaxID=4097 RepID=A0A1S3XB09_TOBAC|nr:PREDICTED: uncharacterized protein LOC107763158 [Nicotiana tabacum]
MKNLQVALGSGSLDYEDLCIHPDVDMHVGYKPSKFDIFNGTGDPHAHLKAYCDKVIGIGRNEKLRMKLFKRSLTIEELTWYTRQDPRNWREWKDMAKDFMNRFGFYTDITPDRLDLVNLQKKPSESFQEYARHWRSKAARTQPPLDDNELTKYFIRAQEGIYFEKMIGIMCQKFSELVRIGDYLEEGIKSGKIQSMATLQDARKATQSGSIGSRKKKKKEEVAIIVPYYQYSPPHRNNSYPIKTHPSHQPTYASVYNTQLYYNARPQYNPPRAP